MRTVVGSDAESLAEFTSFAVDTVAELDTPGRAAALTLTVKVIEEDAPAVSAKLLVHVTVWPAALQVQDVPIAETNVNPAGRTSVIVMRAFVAAVPEFVISSE